MKTLVLGASANPERYSYKAILTLLQHGHQVEALGMKEAVVGGITIQTGFPSYVGIDTVTLYLNPARQEAYISYLLGLHPRRVIFNPGTEHPALYTILEAHGIVAEESCTLVLLTTGQY